ncbi:MAG: DUF1080 domain-containing protein, partial [Pirellulaceae bacterium]
MTRIAVGLLTLVVLTSCGLPVRAEIPLNQLSEAERRGGWTLIFDGKTTAGWRNYRSQKISDGWTVKNGTLTWTKKGAGDLVSVKQYGHFELSLEYRISKAGNSGIMF